MVPRHCAVYPQKKLRHIHPRQQTTLYYALAVIVSFIVLFPLTSKAIQLEGNAEYSLSFGSRVPETAARRIARTVAWLDALEKATNSLPTASLVQWGTEETVNRQVLVSAVVIPAISSTSQGQQVSVRVRLSASQRTVEDRLRKALHEQEILQLRADILRQEKEKAEEACRLIALPITPQRRLAKRSATNEARIVLLAEQLEALRLLSAALPQREGGRWRTPQEALPALQQAVELDPDYAPLQYLRGEILLQLDRPQDALAALDKALALTPELAGALYTRGLAYLRLQLPTFAERDFSAALERNTSNAAWWRARGALRMTRGEIAPMCEDFMQACARGDCEGLAVARERGLCLIEN